MKQQTCLGAVMVCLGSILLLLAVVRIYDTDPEGYYGALNLPQGTLRACVRVYTHAFCGWTRYAYLSYSYTQADGLTGGGVGGEQGRQADRMFL